MSGSSTDATEVKDDAIVESSPTDEEVGAKEPESMLEAVQSVIAVEEDPTPSPDVEEEEGGADLEAETASDDQPPFHEHPRWQEMLAENTALKEGGERFEQFDQYIQSTGLDTGEIEKGIELMKLLKNDPVGAAKMLAPVMEQLQQFEGSGALPEDLQADVDTGKLTEEYARQLSQSRSKSNFYERKTTEQAARTQQDDDDRRQQELETSQEAVKTAVGDWEASWKDSDPDFAKKHPYVRDRVASLARELGRPVASAEEALELSKKAKTQIDTEMSAMFPKKGEKRTVTGGSSVSTQPEPKTLREAIELAAAGEG